MAKKSVIGLSKNDAGSKYQKASITQLDQMLDCGSKVLKVIGLNPVVCLKKIRRVFLVNKNFPYSKNNLQKQPSTVHFFKGVFENPTKYIPKK